MDNKPLKDAPSYRFILKETLRRFKYKLSDLSDDEKYDKVKDYIEIKYGGEVFDRVYAYLENYINAHGSYGGGLEDSNAASDGIDKDYKDRDELLEQYAYLPYGRAYADGTLLFERMSDETLRFMAKQGFVDKEAEYENIPSAGWFLEHMPDSASYGGYAEKRVRAASASIIITSVEINTKKVAVLPEEVRAILEEADEIEIDDYEGIALFQWN